MLFLTSEMESEVIIKAVKVEELTSFSLFEEGEHLKTIPREMGKFDIQMVAVDAVVKMESPLVKVERKILRVFKCELCCREYRSPWWLRLHTLVAHAPEVSNCFFVSSPIVEQTWETKPAISDLNLKQDSKPNQWEDTTGSPTRPTPSETDTLIDNNLRSGGTPGQSTDKFQCALCSHTCTTEDFLEHHIQEHSEETPYKCSSCDFACSTRTKLRVHVLKSHPSGASNGSSEKQDKSPKTPPSKVKGKRRKNIQRAPPVQAQIFECSFCDYSSKKKSSVKAHENRHVEESLNKYHCDQCSYRGPTKSSLRLHSLTHANVPIFNCSVCDYSSRSRKDVLGHEERHFRPNPLLDSLPRAPAPILIVVKPSSND